MHFAAMTEFPSNPPPAVDVTVGMVPAQNIYAMTVALPDFPPGAYNCPIDLGISYKLTFFSGDAIAATASLLPGGCRDVQISDSPPLRWAFDNGYWAALAQQLGVPQSTIY
jgi:hypothetical protein